MPKNNVLKNNALKAVTDKYAFRITDTIKSLISGKSADDPIALQYIPQEKELITREDEHPDPIGDDAHSPVKGIVHRYPDRVLFKPANVCAVYCRYCFRREMVGPKDSKPADILSEDECDAALTYIKNNENIWEVILTGGDPLVLSRKHLIRIMHALYQIPHVKIIRFHTRVPIADPSRITPAIIEAITQKTNQSDYSHKALYMALHINHAAEINDDVKNTILKLHAAGINLLSQSVLLKGVNDDAHTLETLYRELTAFNVKPYYLHHPDFAPGTSHFRVSIERGQDIMKSLLGRLSGICQPTYMLDIPGGMGKIPLTPCYVSQTGDNAYKVTNYRGETYPYPPTQQTKKTKKGQ